jgi:hypothetical protein
VIAKTSTCLLLGSVMLLIVFVGSTAKRVGGEWLVGKSRRGRVGITGKHGALLEQLEYADLKSTNRRSTAAHLLRTPRCSRIAKVAEHGLVPFAESY